MFKAGPDPGEDQGRPKWLTFWFNNPDRIEAEQQVRRRQQAAGRPARADIWTGDAEQKQQRPTKKYANVPQRELRARSSRRRASIPLKLEPPNAQQIYAVLDVADAEGADRQERRRRRAARRRREAGQRRSWPRSSSTDVRTRPPPGRTRPAAAIHGLQRGSRRWRSLTVDAGGQRRAPAGSPEDRRTTCWRTRSWRPASLCFALFSWYPLVRGVILSFQQVNFVTDPYWVGPGQLPGPVRRPAVLDRVEEHRCTSPAWRWSSATPSRSRVAILLNELRHFKGFFRVAVYLPVMLPPIVGVLLWQYFYDPGNGLFNTVLRGVAPARVAVDAVAERRR